MFNDLCELVKKILVEGVPLDTSEIDVVFDAPNSEWKSSLSRPTVNCYLYHIIENHELRRTDWEYGRNAVAKRDGGGHSVTRRRMPYRIDVSFMITAWANAIEDEHRLLWRVLSALMRYTQVPMEFLDGDLATQAWPMPIKVAQPESVFKNPSDFWSGMEVHVKPSVSVILTVALDTEQFAEIPLVLTRRVRVHPAHDPGNSYELPTVQIGGWVMRGKGDAARPVPLADVTLVESGIVTQSDEAGQFKFLSIPKGRYTLRATLDGEQVERQLDVPGDSYDIVLPEESKGVAGTSEARDDNPGPASRERGASRRR